MPGTTAQKARRINVEHKAYGTFAEIGAGQEVARWFFHVGGASATVAKTISAYDMTISDAFYGPCEHYVSRQRLEAILDDEYQFLLDQLKTGRVKTSGLFVLADTFATRQAPDKEGQGWMGIRFQHRPESDPSDVIIHIRLLDLEPAREQETVGIIGVNLVYGAVYLHGDPEELLGSLFDELNRNRIEVDMIQFSGPAFPEIDNRLMTLQLIERGFTDVAMFSRDGKVVQAAEILYQRPVLIERGSFRPVTYASLDILEVASRVFARQLPQSSQVPVTVMEMSLRNLTGDRFEHADFLTRVEILSRIGFATMISNYAHFYALSEYLHRYTKVMTVFALGVPNLQQLLDPKYYTHLDGGILEGIGRLVKSNVRLYAYPSRNKMGKLITADTLLLPSSVQMLYRYLRENQFIQPIEHVEREDLHLLPKDVLAKIQSDEPGWENQVPPEAVEAIKRRRYLSNRGTSDDVESPG
ncbi:MAG TPA: TonB-dependent receptor [Acidobacteriota bacterium]|mgnify:FL=1|nr:TonB-dependent receptor [Acidobacteriota bacterium]